MVELQAVKIFSFLAMEPETKILSLKLCNP